MRNTGVRIVPRPNPVMSVSEADKNAATTGIKMFISVILSPLSQVHLSFPLSLKGFLRLLGCYIIFSYENIFVKGYTHKKRGDVTAHIKKAGRFPRLFASYVLCLFSVQFRCAARSRLLTASPLKVFNLLRYVFCLRLNRIIDAVVSRGLHLYHLDEAVSHSLVAGVTGLNQRHIFFLKCLEVLVKDRLVHR